MKTPLERRIALEAAFLLVAARLAVALLALPRAQRVLRVLAGLLPARRADARLRETIAWAVPAAARRLPGNTSCLVEALAAQQLLLRSGAPADLRIGVRRPGEALAAHAWVESNGRVVVGAVGDMADFQTLEPPGERRVRGFAALLRGEPVAWPAFGSSESAFPAECDDEDLTGLVHRALAAGHADWPGSVVQEIGRRARAYAGLEAVRARETIRVIETLAAAGVRPILLKGTALANTVYAQPWLRPRNDTDLVISPAHRDAARAALLSAGYTPTNYSDGEELFRQYEMRREDELGFTHAVDVHWALSTQAAFAEVFDFGELEARTVPVPPLGLHARALGAVDALLVACVHPAMHHRNEERLIWLYDTHLLAAQLGAADWNRFHESARSKGVAAICRDALTRAMHRLGTAVPAGVLEDLARAAARHEPTARYLRPGRRWGNELASSLGALGWRRRLRLIREVAFPTPRYLLAAYGMTGSRFGPALLPALYAHRGARGVWKVLSGRK